jgi:hypothetical protein
MLLETRQQARPFTWPPATWTASVHEAIEELKAVMQPPLSRGSALLEGYTSGGVSWPAIEQLRKCAASS